MINYPDEAFMIRKKRLSQNFLTDANIAEKIVRLCDINPGDRVIEIGCGDGMLTKFLLETGAEIHGVEVDRDLQENLAGRFAGMTNFTLHHADFMKLDLETLLGGTGRRLVVGNIPYHITTPILFRCLEYRARLDRIVLMMQREVAERITAGTGTKEYGILSVICGLYCDIRILFHIPPSVFSPRPKVESSVIRFDIRKNLSGEFDYELFHIVVRTSFNQRRKMLRNSIRSLLSVSDLEFDFEQRPERLTVDDFVRLTNILSAASTQSIRGSN